MTFLSNTPYNDVCKRISPGPQNMRGFDGKYSDIVDYIIGITYQIWEEKKIGLINDYYTDDCAIHTPAGDVVGAQAVVNNTVQQLSLFPDRRLFPEDLVWAGNDTDGFYSSHRIRSTAHHWGYSAYGEPTGKKLQYSVIADCAVRNNKIYEEWLVRDNVSILRQIGLNEKEFAMQLVQASPKNYQVKARKIVKPKALPPSKKQGFDVEDFIKRTWHNAWNLRMFNSLSDGYLSTVHSHASSGRELFGQGDVIQFAIDWLACFPDASMTFDHFCALGDDKDGYRTSLRWTLNGTHTGYGIYGNPTNRPVSIMGITQAFVHDGKIIEEWNLFDELTIWCQLIDPEKQ